MIRRFQIEDLVAQDASGVVFRALDTETNSLVAVRRLFPFGAEGGGLNAQEQTAYNFAISRLVGLNHPGMRSVICGDCDPIDGMPYVATEWIPGKPLAAYIEHQPLNPTDAINVITCALEVSELLSRVLAQEGIWVETDVRTIVIGDDGTGRSVTFWIAPLKWLSHNQASGNLDSIVALTEEIMGWRAQSVGDDAGSGLGGWLKWLHRASKTTSMREAREKLISSTGMKPPTSTKNLVRPATARPTSPIKSIVIQQKRSGSPMLVAIVFLCLVAAGLGIWAVNRKDPYAPKASGAVIDPAVPATNDAAKTPSPNAAPAKPENRLSAEMREVAAAMASGDKDPQAAAPAEELVSSRDEGKTVFSPDDRQIVNENGREVLLAGVFAMIDYSNSKKTMYLYFSKEPAENASRGAILVSDAGPDLSEAALTPLIGKKIRLRGKLTVQKDSGLQRPFVTIKKRADIEVVP